MVKQVSTHLLGFTGYQPFCDVKTLYYLMIIAASGGKFKVST